MARIPPDAPQAEGDHAQDPSAPSPGGGAHEPAKSVMEAVTGSLKPVLEASKGLQPQLRFPIVFGVLVVVAAAAFAVVDVGTQWPWVLLSFLAVAGFGTWRFSEWLRYGKEGTPGRLESTAPAKPATTPAEPARPSPALPADTLRERYLSALWNVCATVKTTSFKAATGQEAPELSLSAVFTDLDILEGRPERPEAHAPDRIEREAELRKPALDALAECRKLVLLGDPGSGKTTLVDFLTLCLAGHWLRRSEADLQRLGEGWRSLSPAPLPIRVILRDYAARGLPEGAALWPFIMRELAALPTAEGGNLAACEGLIRRALDKPDGAILLLDGVDEVPDAAGRREQLKQAVETFARDFPHCRILVTSRPYAYQKAAQRFAGFEQRALADFTLEQMKAYIERWYAHVGAKDPRLGPGKAAAYAQRLQDEVERRARLQDLAANPLLAALMAWLHRQREGGALPEKRQQLYEESVKHLLLLWQRDKPSYHADGRPAVERDIYTELGIPQDTLRAVLNELAYEAHRDQPVLTGTHDIPVDKLAGALFKAAKAEGAAPDLDLIIGYVTNRTGLLIERAPGKVYCFPHRTFQEYLAACHLTDHEFPDELYEHLRADSERWREAALLAAAKAVTGAKSAIWNVARVFCPRAFPHSPAPGDWYALVSAAEALIESEQHRHVPPRHREVLADLRRYLLRLLDSAEALSQAPRDRAAAGRALGILGDPRFGVALAAAVEGEGAVPEMAWVAVPGTALVRESGRYPGFEGFKLGNGLKPDAEFARQNEAWSSDAQPVHMEAFYLAAYPVTVAQYRPFVEGDGYDNDKYWTKSGWAWRQKENRDQPWLWDDRRWTVDNHPVVGVTWYEAVAYCRWLAKRLRTAARLPASHVVRLPSEAEWEWAARGPEARRWPWGDTWREGACNSEEAELGQTSAVGAFAAGADWTADSGLALPDFLSPSEGHSPPPAALDLAGNVWEWCSTRWQDSYPLPNLPSEWTEDYLAGDHIRAVRGGAFYMDRSRCRGAFRLRRLPRYWLLYWGSRCCVATSDPGF